VDVIPCQLEDFLAVLQQASDDQTTGER